MQPSAFHERLQAIAGSMSFRELADLTHTNHETVRRYMQGHSPSAEFLQAVCTRFSINGQWLLTGRGPMRTADIRAAALQEARAAELLSATASTIERLQERLDRIEAYVQTMETRLRGGHRATALFAEDTHADTAAHPSIVRAREIADAVSKPPRQDDR
ncbi:MAG: hypothetical protein AB7K52_12425 [Phycisphaerales bacterium]